MGEEEMQENSEAIIDDEEDRVEGSEEGEPQEGMEEDLVTELRDDSGETLEDCQDVEEPCSISPIPQSCVALWAFAVALAFLSGPAIAYVVLAAGDAYGLLPA